MVFTYYLPTLTGTIDKKETGSAHRDVLGGRIGAACRGHHRGALGQQGIAVHDQRTEQEGICEHRELAEAAADGPVSVRLCGWRLPEAELGR